MSVVEVRQVMQDFLAPELRALSARMDALEAKVDSRFMAAEEKVALRQDVLLSRIESIKTQLELDRRLQKLEAQRAEPAA